MLRRVMALVFVLTSYPVFAAAAQRSECQEKTAEGCASTFARTMTRVIKNIRTGRGPFVLTTATSAGSRVTMTFVIDMSAREFDEYEKEEQQAHPERTRESFLALTHIDFGRYQCDSPVGDLLKHGVQVNNVLAFQDGSELDAFDLECATVANAESSPPGSEGAHPDAPLLNLGPPEDPYIIPWPKGSDGKILTGKTVLMILVSAQGRPMDIRVETSSGYRALDAATIEAAKRRTFEPRKKNGVPVEGYVRLPFAMTDS